MFYLKCVWFGGGGGGGGGGHVYVHGGMFYVHGQQSKSM